MGSPTKIFVAATAIIMFTGLCLFIYVRESARKEEPSELLTSDAHNPASVKRAPVKHLDTNRMSITKTVPLSSYVSNVLNHPKDGPSFRDFPGPSTADKAALIEQYVSLGSIRNKIGIEKPIGSNPYY
jgi:hypothetical protein